MVVVTGGTGFVGSRLIFDLVSNGKNVTALLRPNTSNKKFIQAIKYYTPDPDSIAEKVTWMNGSLDSVEDLQNAIHKGDRVYHCAAKVSFNPKENADTIETNVEGTANLVNVCLEKGVDKLCHISSIGALGGKINGELIDEETPWSSAGKSTYSLSKYYSELEVWRGIAEGLNAVIVNPSVILGPGNWNTGSPRLFSTVAKGLTFYTKGSTGYVDVRDVSKAMTMLMNSDINSERFLLSSENISYQKLFTLIANSVKVKPPKIYASRFITGLGYRFDKLRSIIFGSEPVLTKQTHQISHSINQYSGNKIVKSLKFDYTPISETISFIGNCYMGKY